MAFQFWEDEEMTRAAGGDVGGVPLHSLFFDENGAQYADLLLYFGSPQTSYRLQARNGADPVTLTPAAALPLRENGRAYAQGDTVSDGLGFVHRCVAAGQSGQEPPRWLTGRGARTRDGEAAWHCLGAAHQAQAVRLALSAQGLDSAQDGAPLTLGAAVRGGAALAVHMRVFNRVADRYDAPFVPQIGLDLNDCVEVEDV